MKIPLGFALLCTLLSACSTTPFGPPDDPAQTIQPARPSPFEGTVSGGAASPWTNGGIDTESPPKLSY